MQYYNEYLDNMETYDLTPQKNTKLIYNDKWTRTCENQGMYTYQRSMSYSTGAGASLTYTFKGTGLELLGYNDSEKTTVNVTVDGTSYKQADPIWKADNMCTAYQVAGLTDSEHTVTIELASGSIAVDAVAVLGAAYEGEEINKIPEEVMPSPTPEVTPGASPLPETPGAVTPAPQSPDTSSVSKGYSFKIKDMTYVVTDVEKKTVALKKTENKKIKAAVVPASVKVNTAGSFRVTEISDKAFADCSSLTKVTIGKNVTSIGKEAFAKDKALKKLVIKSSGLKKVGKNAIKGISGKAKISCGKKNVTAYKKLFTAKTGYIKSMKITK